LGLRKAVDLFYRPIHLINISFFSPLEAFLDSLLSLFLRNTGGPALISMFVRAFPFLPVCINHPHLQPCVPFLFSKAERNLIFFGVDLPLQTPARMLRLSVCAGAGSSNTDSRPRTLQLNLTRLIRVHNPSPSSPPNPNKITCVLLARDHGFSDPLANDTLPSRPTPPRACRRAEA